MLFILIATTLSPLGLIFFNSMLALLAIKYFPIISYLFLLDDPFKNENKVFLGFYFFVDFQLNFLTQHQKNPIFVVQKSKAKRIQSLLTLFYRV
jgi:hypothetical protein